MRVRTDGENRHGVTEVISGEDDTPLDVYHVVAALTTEPTKEELDALERVYVDSVGECQESDTDVPCGE